MKLLTKEQQESHENGKICYICKEEFENNYLKDKKYHKIRDHCNFTRGGGLGGAAQNLCTLKYSIPKKIYIVFHNGSNYNYHFIVNKRGSRRKKIY